MCQIHDFQPNIEPKSPPDIFHPTYKFRTRYRTNHILPRQETVEEKFDKQLFRVHFEMRDNNPVHMPYQMKKTAPSQKSFIMQ